MLFVIISSSLHADDGGQRGPISARIEEWSGSAVPGEPLILSLDLKNDVSDTAYFDLGADYIAGINIVVRDSRGYERSGKIQRHGGLFQIGKVAVDGHQTKQRLLVISDWGITLPPGTYTITTSLINPAKVGQDSVAVEPAHTTVTIENTQDDVKIANHCEDFRQQYESSTDSSQAYQAAVVLRHFTSPASLKCLELAYSFASRYPYRSLLLDGISAVRTPESRAFLQEVAQREGQSENGEYALQLLNNPAK